MARQTIKVTKTRKYTTRKTTNKKRCPACGRFK